MEALADHCRKRSDELREQAIRAEEKAAKA